MNATRFSPMELLKLISDSGNPIASKFITYLGVGVGVGGGTAQGIARNSQNDFIQYCADQSPEWLAYAPAIGVASLVIKNISDWYFKRIEVKLAIKKSEDETD
jgi:uncharacterized protein YneR